LNRRFVGEGNWGVVLGVNGVVSNWSFISLYHRCTGRYDKWRRMFVSIHVGDVDKLRKALILKRFL
jgi:hypothetical protein